MTRLYHRRSPNFQGHLLYPLNRLRDVAPDSYQQHRRKYDGRERLMEQVIPSLDCLWNDVIHLSPVHPARMSELARASQVFWSEADWYEFDPAALGFSKLNTAVFLYRDMSADVSIRHDEFEDFDLERLPEYSLIPQRTRDYYKTADKSGRYFIFAGVPHVLHNGVLDVTEVPIVRA